MRVLHQGAQAGAQGSCQLSFLMACTARAFSEVLHKDEERGRAALLSQDTKQQLLQGPTLGKEGVSLTSPRPIYFSSPCFNRAGVTLLDVCHNSR